MSKRNALAFAAGFGGAYLKGKERQQEMERQKVEDAWRDEQRNAWRAEQADKQTMRTSLADAIKPTTVDGGYQVSSEAGSNAFTKDRDAAAMMSDMVADQRPSLGRAYRAGGQTFTDRAGAETAATEYNSPPAMLDRMSTAVAPMDPAKSLSLRSAATTARTAEQKQQDELRQRAKELETEGVQNAYRAMLARDPEGIMTAFNQSGSIRLKEPPRLVETRTIKTPYGEIEDDVWEGVAIGPDGKEAPIRRSTQQVAMQLYDVKDLIKDGREAQKMGLQQRNALELEGVKSGNRVSLEQLRQSAPRTERTSNEGAVTREERLRYTSLFADAGRRQSEAQKAYNTLIREGRYARAQPGSREAQELESLRETIKQYGEERKTYQSLLAQGSAAPGTQPGLAGAVSGPTNAAEQRMAQQTQGGMGADPAAIRREIAAAQADLERVPDENSRRMLTEHIANMQRQLASLGGNAPRAQGLSAVQAPQRSAPQQSGQPPRITSAAEHAALPKGTRYVAPNGQIYIKQ